LNWETYGRFKGIHGSQFEIELKESNSKFHPRRTLDQYYYPSLHETVLRDVDQTISKWTGTHAEENLGKELAVGDSQMIMVDQLWCWVIDGSK
jgi:hypothetical protein